MVSMQDSPARPPRRIAPTGQPARFAAARLALVGALLALAGCSSGPYPSLSRWSAEHAGNQPPPKTKPAPPTTPVPMTCDEAAADRIDAEFKKTLPTSETVLRGVGDAATGSPAWSKGNLALADLQNIRARLGQVLAPAEQAYVADTQNHAQLDARDGIMNRPDGARLATCYAHIDSLASAEDAEIERLHTMLPD